MALGFSKLKLKAGKLAKLKKVGYLVGKGNHLFKIEWSAFNGLVFIGLLSQFKEARAYVAHLLVTENRIQMQCDLYPDVCMQRMAIPYFSFPPLCQYVFFFYLNSRVAYLKPLSLCGFIKYKCNLCISYASSEGMPSVCFSNYCY